MVVQNRKFPQGKTIHEHEIGKKECSSNLENIQSLFFFCFVPPDISYVIGGIQVKKKIKRRQKFFNLEQIINSFIHSFSLEKGTNNTLNLFYFVPFFFQFNSIQFTVHSRII